MGSFRQNKKEDEDGGGNPYMNIEKTFLLQEARTFNETPVNPRKCTHILTKILYLLNQGENLSTTEATEAFFAMTKLFQSRDVILRRMVYLGIKELSSIADDVIIVTSSLTKDMTGKEDLYRAAAIRALCSITDATMLQGIERYMKQAIIDRNPAVSSAALVSSLHLTKIANDVIKRMANEAQELAVNSDNVMVQYHALGVLYHIRKTDRLAVRKLVKKLTSSSMKSPYAVCMLIRIVCKLIDEDEMISHPHESPLFEFIGCNLAHKSEMVVYEAAQGIANLKRTTHREIGHAISVLQLFCASPKATLRFGAARTLNKIAMLHPTAIGGCNIDLENLITDSNRSIATLAITTLLKTGTESSVDRLMKQISTFVSEISDEFKVVVVQAIKQLCITFPRKHLVLMTFLSGMLRDEGGLEYKASIADTIIIIIEENPEAKEIGLAHLCEFIEDCEHTLLAVRILHLLGKEGPRTKTPSRYIRFIYNRVILECASIRAAAVAALAQFGAACPDLRDNICVLLSRCQMDSDDEVRDRATYYTSILQNGDKKLINDYIISNQEMSIPALERALRDYLERGCMEPFDLNSVPLAPIVPESVLQVTTVVDEAPLIQEKLMNELSGLDAFRVQGLGPLFHSSEPVNLTESETEYTVRCIKHTYAQHLVLQFDCLNTLSDQLLVNVHIQLEPPDGFQIVTGVPIEKLPYNEVGSLYVILLYPDRIQNCIGQFGATLKFEVKDCDPNTGIPDSDLTFRDEYMLEDIDLTLADQIDNKRTPDFEYAWDDETKNYIELQETFELSQFTTLDQAVKSLIKFLGFRPHNRSEKVPEGKTTHAISLSGTYRGNLDALVKCKLALGGGGITMQLTLRCMDKDLAELIMSTVG